MMKTEQVIKQQLDKLYQKQVLAYTENDDKKKVIQGAIQGIEWVLGISTLKL